MPILHFINTIYNNLNSPNNDYVMSIFIDLKKAFDTVDFNILLEKLEFYGFRGMSNLWFKNYLFQRTQFTEIGGIRSSKVEMKCGVPQGSILGPILFLLFINDLPNSSNFFSLLYADDTTLQIWDENFDNLYQRTNIELSKISDWFKCNKLTLNTSKTKYMLFRNKQKPVNFATHEIVIENQVIERIGQGCSETSFKFVGIYLDEFLTWEPHISNVLTKLSSANYIISSIKNFFPIETKLNIYNSLFKSHIDYGSVVWSGALTHNQLGRLVRAQKRCVRNIVGAGYREHTNPIFKRLSLLKMVDILDFNNFTFMHKFTYGKLPSSFQSIFKPTNRENRSMTYILEKTDSKLQKLPNYFLIKSWNKLSLNTKRIQSLTSFKNTLRTDILSKY